MIKLRDLLEGIETVEFVSPEDTELNYYSDVNDMEKESGIRVSHWKHLELLAVQNEKCVGALFTGIMGRRFSFDIVVDKTARRQGIASKLIDYGLAEFKDLPQDEGYYLELQVVNAHLIAHLEKKGLKIIDKRGGHIIMSF